MSDEFESSSEADAVEVVDLGDAWRTTKQVSYALIYPDSYYGFGIRAGFVEE